MNSPFSTNTRFEKMAARFAGLSFVWQFLLFVALSLLLFLPVTGNSFVSDDFIVLKKVGIEKQLNTAGFFRPLSDITLYMNFLLHGFHPAGYYIFNIVVHALGALLLFYCCRRMDRDVTALLAALFFLVYPFHSESIVWILGRASLLANTFAMLGLVILVGKARETIRIAGVSLCYFIAMSGYETVAVLPAMVFVWLLFQRASLKRLILWMSALSLTLVLHVLVRMWVSGALAGDYGGGFFHVSVLGIAQNIGKVVGRLFLPPMDSNYLLAVGFVLVIGLMAWLSVRLWKQIRQDRFFLQMAAFLLLALLVPFFFGLSSHTSEGDRLLHFPSFFFCALLAFVTIRLRWGLMAPGLIVYFFICLQITNNNWQKASGAVRELLGAVQNHSGPGRLYIVNLPGEIDGAYVFRVGFPEALEVQGLQAGSVQVVNEVKRDSLNLISGAIVPRRQGQAVLIPPQVVLTRDGNQLPDNAGNDGTFALHCKKEDEVIYWNKKKWVRF